MENQFSHMAVGAGRWIADGLFPRFCISCEVEGSYFCVPCQSVVTVRAIGEACPYCGEKTERGAVCVACKPAAYLDGVVSLGWYRDRVWQRAIDGLKYHGDPQMGEVIRQLVQRSDLSSRLPSGAWSVVALPLHPHRQRERGFNQADIIAAAVAETVEADPCVCPSLRRVRSGSSQARTGSSERRVGEMDGAFVADPPVPPEILLCDDVFTSGATIEAAARAFKEAGARRIWAVTLARARAAALNV